MSDWMVEAAGFRSQLEAGKRGIEEWEAENGLLTEAELAEAKLKVDALIGRSEGP